MCIMYMLNLGWNTLSTSTWSISFSKRRRVQVYVQGND